VTENLADQIIKRAITRIEAGWTQFQSSDQSQNNVCLTRALNEAADEVSANMPEMPAIEVVAGHSQQHVFAGPDQALAEATTRVNQAIGELQPGMPVKDSMIVFNDTVSSKADVLAVLNKALVNAN
jgi:hypothetical protein